MKNFRTFDRIRTSFFASLTLSLLLPLAAPGNLGIALAHHENSYVIAQSNQDTGSPIEATGTGSTGTSTSSAGSGSTTLNSTHATSGGNTTAGSTPRGSWTDTDQYRGTTGNHSSSGMSNTNGTSHTSGTTSGTNGMSSADTSAGSGSNSGAGQAMNDSDSGASDAMNSTGSQSISNNPGSDTNDTDAYRDRNISLWVVLGFLALAAVVLGVFMRRRGVAH